MISLAEKAELKRFLDALPQITAALARHAAGDPEAKRLHQTLIALGAGEASTPGTIFLAAGEGGVPAERDLVIVEMADADPESVERDRAAQKIILAEQSKGNTITYIEALRRVEMADTGVR